MQICWTYGKLAGMSWTLLAFSGMMSYPWENNNVCNFAGRGCRCPMDRECRKLYRIGIKDHKSQIGTRNISSECVRYTDTIYLLYLCKQLRYRTDCHTKKLSWMNDSPAASCRIAHQHQLHYPQCGRDWHLPEISLDNFLIIWILTFFAPLRNCV